MRFNFTLTPITVDAITVDIGYGGSFATANSAFLNSYYTPEERVPDILSESFFFGGLGGGTGKWFDSTLTRRHGRPRSNTYTRDGNTSPLNGLIPRSCCPMFLKKLMIYPDKKSNKKCKIMGCFLCH